MKIRCIDPLREPGIVEAIARVYQQSFGHDPWNEGYLCPLCEKKFPLTYTGKTCPVCEQVSISVLVVEYWPISKIIADFYREMKRPAPICVVAQAEQEVVGFAWGYQAEVSSELAQHLDAPNINQVLTGTFFYLDECAVSPGQQGKGIGKMLVEYIFRIQAEGRIILRTLHESKMYALITKVGGEIIQHISNQRVIMKISA